MNRKQSQKSSLVSAGFTLVEVVVMIAMVAIAFIGINKVYVRVVKDAREKNKELVAGNLAQEFVEVVREIRDSNYQLEGNEWYQGLTGCGGNQFVISDYASSTLACASTNNTGLHLSGDKYVFCAESAADKEFTRYATIVVDEGDPETGEVGVINVTVEVSWKDGSGNTRRINLNDSLYHWQNYAAASEAGNVLSDQATAGTWGGPTGITKLKFAYNVARKQDGGDMKFYNSDPNSTNDQIGRAKFEWIYDDTDASTSSRQSDWRIIDKNNRVIAQPDTTTERRATTVYVPLCNASLIPSEVRSEIGCDGVGWAGIGEVLEFRLVVWDDSGNMTIVPKKENVPIQMSTSETVTLDPNAAEPRNNACLKKTSNTFKWGNSTVYTNDPYFRKLQSYYEIKIKQTDGPTTWSQGWGEFNNENRKTDYAKTMSQSIDFSSLGFNYGSYTWDIISHGINYGANWSGTEEGKTWSQVTGSSFRINQPIDVACSHSTGQSSPYLCDPYSCNSRTCKGSPCTTYGISTGTPRLSGCTSTGGCTSRSCDSRFCGTTPCTTQGGGCNSYSCNSRSCGTSPCSTSGGGCSTSTCNSRYCGTSPCSTSGGGCSSYLSYYSCNPHTCSYTYCGSYTWDAVSQTWVCNPVTYSYTCYDTCSQTNYNCWDTCYTCWDTCYTCWDTCYDCYDSCCSTCYDCSETAKFKITDDLNCDPNKGFSVTGSVTCSGTNGVVGDNSCSIGWRVKNTSCSYGGTVTVNDNPSNTYPNGSWTDSCNY